MQQGLKFVDGALPFWRDFECNTHYNARVKVYGDTYKIQVWNVPIFNPDGWEAVGKPPPLRLPKDPDNAERADNLRRAKNAVYDIAFANDWTHFVTCTLDSAKCDRYDVNALKAHLKIMLSNAVARQGLRYLIVPEHHKDGALHLHGLVAADDLRLADSGTVLTTERAKPVKIATAKRAGYNIKKQVFNWGLWTLGHSTAIPLDENKEAVSAYVTKYITKEQVKIFGKRFLAGGAIERNVQTLYANLDFEEVDGISYMVAPNRHVKYLDIDKEGQKIKRRKAL